jgi:hypothetical protein
MKNNAGTMKNNAGTHEPARSLAPAQAGQAIASPQLDSEPHRSISADLDDAYVYKIRVTLSSGILLPPPVRQGL